jgi:hypothetical protein
MEDYRLESFTLHLRSNVSTMLGVMTLVIVEKTAGYVVKQGAQFEEKIRQKEMHNPKFCFLNPADPYRPFYDYRLRQIKEGKGNAEKRNKQ